LIKASWLCWWYFIISNGIFEPASKNCLFLPLPFIPLVSKYPEFRSNPSCDLGLLKLWLETRVGHQTTFVARFWSDQIRSDKTLFSTFLWYLIWSDGFRKKWNFLIEIWLKLQKHLFLRVSITCANLLSWYVFFWATKGYAHFTRVCSCDVSK
jgi:hypothetical protein